MTSAYLDTKKFTPSSNRNATSVDQDMMSDVKSKVIAMQEAKGLPKKSVKSIVNLEKMILKRSQLVEKYAFDFHKGLQNLQE